MNDLLLKVNKKLDKYGQEHLLWFYDSLSEDEKKCLLNQILSIDFDFMCELYKNSMKNDANVLAEVTPLSHVEKERLSQKEISSYRAIGETEIKQGNFAVVTMAGGQGTRLGYSGPKGTYPLALKPVKKSLFQIMAEDIERANDRYQVTIPWYIMTSQDNDLMTKAFFEENSYFGYPADLVCFFKQDKLPLVGIDGNFILEEPHRIKEGSNGNGNVFAAMKKNGILEHMKLHHIKWISFGGIDNVLLKNVDPLFLGMMIKHGQVTASKTIFKQEPLEKTAVYCRKNGKPAILDYDVIDLALSEEKDESGLYVYREANMLSHLMSFEAVDYIADIQLPYHRAFKKNAFVNSEGVKQVPDRANTFKFENFIFDAFSFFDDLLLLRVNADEEFAPIKDFRGMYNPDTAREKYERFWNLRDDLL